MLSQTADNHPSLPLYTLHIAAKKTLHCPFPKQKNTLWKSLRQLKHIGKRERCSWAHSIGKVDRAVAHPNWQSDMTLNWSKRCFGWPHDDVTLRCNTLYPQSWCLGFGLVGWCSSEVQQSSHSQCPVVRDVQPWRWDKLLLSIRYCNLVGI